VAGKTYFFSVFFVVLLSAGLAAVANHRLEDVIGDAILVVLAIVSFILLVLGLASLTGPVER
jgi:uncharacterized membrane protein YiaA